MPQPSLTKQQMQQAVDAVCEYGTVTEAATALDMPAPTLDHRYRRAVQKGFESQKRPRAEREAASLRLRVQALERQLRQQENEDVSAKWVKEQIYQLHETNPTPPGWSFNEQPIPHRSPGVPTLFLSDWHWGEVVDKDAVDGANAFDLSIAHQRAKRVMEVSTDLLMNHLSPPDYPGIVVVLGGDMISGDIHQELVETNGASTVETLLDLQGVLVQSIEYLADRFGAVFLPCVVGNHGRSTQKPRAKRRVHTSYDWLLYRELESYFARDERVQFLIPDSPDCLYQVFDHRYRLTHGDQFKGGDGMIGPLGPITRGDHKKRSRDEQIGRGYDTMLLGHFHQLILMQRLIVNGSLVGYNEYAHVNNFPYERARQGLWLTHPDLGITFPMPVFADPPPKRDRRKKMTWVSAPEAA